MIGEAFKLLDELTRRGIELVADGDRLRYRPAHRMPPDLLARVRAHKADLLAILAAEKAPAGPRREAPDPQPPRRVPAVYGAWRGHTRVPEGVCPWCGSSTWRDIPIHGGRTIRRDCAACHRFIRWVRWLGAEIN